MKKPAAALRPYYQRGDVTIYHADFRTVLPELADGSVDMLFSDPPYGINQNKNDLNANLAKALGRKRKGRTRVPIANDGPEANGLFAELLAHSLRLLPPGGVCCACCAGGGGTKSQAFAEWPQLIREKLAFKQMIVWDKGPMGIGWHYRRSFELVLVAMKPGARCAWYDTTHRVEDVIRPGMHGIKKVPGRKRTHPTEKPPELARWFIGLHTQPGQLVLDAFMGTGSTLLGALQSGRGAIGIELEQRYCKIAAERVERWYGEAESRGSRVEGRGPAAGAA